jgi:hypothetical protein
MRRSCQNSLSFNTFPLDHCSASIATQMPKYRTSPSTPQVTRPQPQVDPFRLLARRLFNQLKLPGLYRLFQGHKLQPRLHGHLPDLTLHQEILLAVRECLGPHREQTLLRETQWQGPRRPGATPLLRDGRLHLHPQHKYPRLEHHGRQPMLEGLELNFLRERQGLNLISQKTVLREERFYRRVGRRVIRHRLLRI